MQVKKAQSYLVDLQKRGILSAKEVVNYSDRLANARNVNEVSIIQDELRRKASNNIAKGVAQTAAGTAADVFLVNEQRLQQQGEEPWLINISGQPWAKWNLIEDVPYIIQGVEPDPRDYANGGKLMITKRNTYRPHYFGFGGGAGTFQEVTQEGNSSMYQQQLNQQGLGQESGTNWGSVGMGAAGAASGLVGQIGVSEKNPNGLWDAADPMHYLANGRTSKFGDGASKLGIGLTQAGLSTGNPWLAAAGAAVKIIGDLGDAGWGHKTDEEQLARVNAGIDAGNNFQSTANSFAELQNPMVLAQAGNVYEGGWFNKKKWKRKNEELQANVAEAQANIYNQFNNNLNNLQQDQMNSMLANYAAFGGPLHTHGSDWTNGITYVDNGGSHESNPYGGVPMGIAQDGQPNLVEEGEVIYKLNGSPYVYSKRIKMPRELKDKYKFKGDTFADGALEAQKESEERPNDPISQRGLNAIMMDLANEQEKKRAEKAERQAKYAFGGWLTDGHKFATGSVMGGPPPRILFKGKYPLALASDGLHYEGDVMGSRYKVTAKDAFANPDDYSTLLDEVDTIAQRNQIPSLTDAEIAEMNRLEAAKSIRTGAVNLNPVSEEDLFYKSNPQFIDPVRGRVPMDYITNILGTYAIDPKLYNSDWWNGGYKAQTATQTVPSTSISKSTSTNKVTGTTSKTTGRQLTDGEKKMQEWLFSNPENFALANKAASEWGARNFKDANDIWKVALTGEPGPAYNGIDEAYRKANKTTWEDLVGRPSFEYATPDEEMKATLTGSADRFYNTEEGVEARQKAWEKANGAARDVNNPIDNYRTWMRYAPIFGSGLALALDPWINRPDYTNADLVAEAGKSAGNVDFNPIGDYLPYKPYDRLFYANQLAAQQAATRRALLNTTGGNAATARGLLLAADNQGINQMGNLWRQAEEYNEANRQAIAEFNRGTNMFNSEGRLKADMANQGQANVRINAAIEAAKLRALEDDRVAETRSANFTNFLDNLGDLGRENLYYNMVNNNNALYYGQNKKGESIYKGEGSTNNPVTMPMPIQQYTKTGKNGGYLTIKKKKR